MKLKEAIRQADALRANALPDEIKAGWVYELEGKLADLRGAPPPVRSWPSDLPLIMPPPADNVYVTYLCAMIDYANEETGLYANDMTLFNAAWAEAAAWWRRKHRPPDAGGIMTV